MRSYSPALLRAFTIACTFAATSQAGAQRAEPIGVQPLSPALSVAIRAEPIGVQPVPTALGVTGQAPAPASFAAVPASAPDSQVMEGSLDPCVADSAACAYPPPVADRCSSKAYRVATRSAAAGTFVGAQAVLWSYFENAWWSGQEAKGFYVRADWDDRFRDQDKWGHLFGGYHLTRIGAGVLSQACMSPNKAMMLSAIYATVFQLQIELWDAKFEKYGFSYPDLLANSLGMAYAVAQHKYPRLKSIKPTFSYSRTDAMRDRDEGRLPNSEIRHSLDYSGQTYWVSAEVDPFLPVAARRYWPDLIRFSVGHSITDWIDAGTGHDRRAQRKILLSLDIDAEKLPGNHPAWRVVKSTLSYIRLPAPALQITPDLKLVPWYK